MAKTSPDHGAESGNGPAGGPEVPPARRVLAQWLERLHLKAPLKALLTRSLVKRIRYRLRRLSRGKVSKAIDRPIPELSRTKPSVPKGDGAERRVERMRGQLEQIARSDKPIIVGPWLSEVGFEVLYWIPFLNWAAAEYQLRPERLIAVSRGGPEPWYRHLASRYFDVMDLYSAPEYLAKNQARFAEYGGKSRQKQNSVSEFEREIFSLLQQNLNFKDAELLSPSGMYSTFPPYWKGDKPFSWIRNYVSFQKFPTILDQSATHSLPEEYIAVRFYSRKTFKRDELNQRFVVNILNRLTERTNVVLLNPDFRMDTHSEILRPKNKRQRARVYLTDSLMSPRNNLAVQSAIISKARAFVGTYGGFSYLAPYYGVPSITFYSGGEESLATHLETARRAFWEIGGGAFIALHVRDFRLLDLVSALDAPSAPRTTP